MTLKSPRVESGFAAVLAAVAALAVYLVWTTWARWGDVVIDLGRELEVAWKLAEGQVLYADVAYNYGPLSPYVNSMLLRLLGTDLSSLVVGGLLSVALGSWLVYRVARRFLDRTASAAIVPVFLLECAFQHYYWNGGFNFVLPYSFPAVHGTLLALGALLAAFRYLDEKGRSWLVLAGVLSGLSMLCKIEVAAAIFLALLAATTLIARRIWSEPIAGLRDTVAWAVPAGFVAAIGYLPFVAATSAGEVFGRNVFRTDLVDVRSNVFFARQLGLENPADSFGKLAVSCLFWAGAIALLWGATRIRSRTAGVVVGLSLVGASWFVPIHGGTLYRCLPIVALAVFAASVRRSHASRSLAAGSVLAVFALVALGRILFNAGPLQYGFFLAVPAFALFGVFLASYVPRWLRVEPSARPLLAALLLALLVCQSTRNFATQSAPRYAMKNLEMSGTGGRILAHGFRARYAALHEALEYLAQNSDPDETLLVLPEGAAVNFLAGRMNPTSFNLFTPPELNAPGVERRLIEQIDRHRVDLILLVDRQVTEYGYRAPGVDYALDLWKVIVRDYTLERQFGAIPPFSRPGVEGGAVLLRRRP